MLEGYHNPLALDFAQQAQTLLSRLRTTHISAHDASVLQDAAKEVLAPHLLLPTLSRLLATPAFTMPTLEAFLPILMDLCARWIHDESINEVDRLDALALLVEIHEEVYP